MSIRYIERLAEAAIEPSVGSTGDSYDKALAEAFIGLHKTEEIHRRGPWKGVEEVEFATAEWVAWYNTSRPPEPIGYVPPKRVRAGLIRPPDGSSRTSGTHVTSSSENPARFTTMPCPVSKHQRSVREPGRCRFPTFEDLV